MERFHYNKQIKPLILIAEAEVSNREILRGILEEEYELLFAEDGAQALDLVRDRKDDLSMILLDLLMSRAGDADVLKALQADKLLKRIPVVVMTSEQDTEAECLKLGAVDFLAKPYDMPVVILSRISRLIELYEDRRLISSTERDQMTGLYAGPFFFEYCSIMDRYYPDRPMDAIVLNIDHFHLINEIYGRSFANDLLIQLAGITKRYANANEGIAGRGMADNYYMYINHQDDYAALAEEFNSFLSKSYPKQHIHLRIGIYQKKDNSCLPEQFFEYAWLAGKSLRNQFRKDVAVFDSELQKRLVYHERLIHDIHTGLEQNQFIARFQPKYDITGPKPKLVGAEALVRWNHPLYGMIPPGEFIRLFEKNGLIHYLDHFIWEQAAAQIRSWRDTCGVTVPVSVNASRVDFYDSDIVEQFCDIVERHGIEPKDLHIEITESSYTEDTAQLIEVVNELRSKGFMIEMDDFGTGYSALNLLSAMPIDYLKVDMSFTRSMYLSERNFKMVEIVIQIAHTMQVPVVAEGVETKQQYDDLKRLGCELVQGFYFSEPVDTEAFRLLLS